MGAGFFIRERLPMRYDRSIFADVSGQRVISIS
jgi:hypothetical protein